MALGGGRPPPHAALAINSPSHLARTSPQLLKVSDLPVPPLLATKYVIAADTVEHDIAASAIGSRFAASIGDIVARPGDMTLFVRQDERDPIGG